jgi:hypothetical protein
LFQWLFHNPQSRLHTNQVPLRRTGSSGPWQTPTHPRLQPERDGTGGNALPATFESRSLTRGAAAAPRDGSCVAPGCSAAALKPGTSASPVDIPSCGHHPPKDPRHYATATTPPVTTTLPLTLLKRRSGLALCMEIQVHILKSRRCIRPDRIHPWRDESSRLTWLSPWPTNPIADVSTSQEASHKASCWSSQHVRKGFKCTTISIHILNGRKPLWRSIESLKSRRPPQSLDSPTNREVSISP